MATSPARALPDVDPLDALLRRAAATPGTIGFAGGLPSARQFPRRGMIAAFVGAVAPPEAAALQYGWPEGEATLRAWIATRLRGRGAPVAPEDVIVTSGAQQAIALAVQLTCRRGDRVAVDPESYAAALQLFRGRGLEPTTTLTGACAAYVMPALANPRGGSLGQAARERLHRARIPVIEDDAYADLPFGGAVPPPLLAQDRRRVFHVGTFSKTLCPGLRVGWLVPPPHLLRRALARKSEADLQANGLAQAILADFLGRTDFDARLRSLRRYYGRKARRLVDAVRRRVPSWRVAMPEGGFSVWVETDVAADEGAFLARAVDAGTSFDPGSWFRADAAVAPLAFRLSFSAVDDDRIDEGVARLARAWRGASRRRSAATASHVRAKPAASNPDPDESQS